MRKVLGLSLAAIAALGLGSHRLRRDAEAAFPEQKPPSKLSWKTKDLPDYLSTDWKRELDGELVPWDWPIQRHMLESWGPYFSNDRKKGAMFTKKEEFNEELKNYLESKRPYDPKQWTKLEMGFHPKNAGMTPRGMLMKILRDANISTKHDRAWGELMVNFQVPSEGSFRLLGLPVPEIVGLYEDNNMTYYLLKWEKCPVNKKDRGGTIYSDYVFKDLYSIVGVVEDGEGNDIAEVIGSLTLQKKNNTEALKELLESNYIPEFRYDYSDLLKKQQNIMLSFVVKETHNADLNLAGPVKQTKFWYMREGKPPIAFFLQRDHKFYQTKTLGGYGEISWVHKILRNPQNYLGKTRTGKIQVVEGKRQKISPSPLGNLASQPCPLEDIENEEQMWLNRLVLSIMVDDFNLSDRRINAFNKDKEAWWATQDNVFREGVESGLLIWREKPLEHLYDEFLKSNRFTRSSVNQSQIFLDSLNEKMLALNYVNKDISDEAKKYLSDNTKPNKFYWRPFLLTSVIALDRYANIIQSGIPSIPNVSFENYLKKRLKSASASNPKKERMMMFPYNLSSFEFEHLVGLKVNGEYLGPNMEKIFKALYKIHKEGEVCSNQNIFSPHEKLFEDPEWRLLQKRLNAWNPLDNGPKN